MIVMLEVGIVLAIVIGLLYVMTLLFGAFSSILDSLDEDTDIYDY